MIFKKEEKNLFRNYFQKKDKKRTMEKKSKKKYCGFLYQKNLAVFSRFCIRRKLKLH